MPISFSCATCGKPYVVDERFAGKKAACRMCGNVNLIPSAEYAAGAPLPLPTQQQQPGARQGVIPDDFDPLPLSAAEPEPEPQDTLEFADELPAKSPESTEPVIPVMASEEDDDDALLELVDDEPPPPRVKGVTPVPVQPVPVEPLYQAPAPPMPAKPAPGQRAPVVPVPESPQRPAPARPIAATPLRALTVEECPNCGSPLEPNAIFCTACGYNLKTGQAVATNVLAGRGHAEDEDDDDDLPAATAREPNPALRMAALLLLVSGIACSVLGILAVPFPALSGLTTAGPVLGAMLCVIGAVIYFIEQQTPFAIVGGIATLFSLILMFAIGRKPAPPPPPPAVAATLPATAPTTRPELPKVERTGPDTFTVRKPKPGTDVIAYWRPVLQDADPGIRLVAIEQLRKIPAPWTGGAVDEIATRANADEDVAVRRSAMAQIALASTPKTVAAAIKGLDDPDPDVAALALKALATFKDESAITPLASHHATMGDKVLDVLAVYPAASRAKVAEAYRSILTATTDAQARGRLLGLIVGKLNPADAGPLLVQYLNDPDPETRATAMGYLGQIRYGPAVPQVIEHLSQDPGPAAKALLAYGPVAEKALDDKLMASGGDAKTRLQVLWVLKQTATIGSLQVVQAVAKDPDLNVALGAREVWRKIDPQGLSPVDEVLMDLDGTKPFQVRALAALKTLPMDDRRAEIARRLFAMVGGTAGSTAAGGAAADAEVQGLACDLLKTWADDPVKDLVIGSLRAEADANKLTCLIHLAVFWKDTRAVKPLCDMLAQSKGTPEIMTALTEFGSAPEDQLIKMLAGTDSGLQEKACDLLKEVGTRRCFRALTAIANNKTGDEKMKKLAKETIVDINRRLNTAEAAAAAAAKAGSGAGATTAPASRPALPRPATKPAGASLW